jgi:hypothetical protein
MKLTNNLGLPDTFVNAISRPSYTKGDAQISATEILNSPRIVQLKRQHWAVLEEDAADMVWSLFGSAVHEVLQHGKDDHHIVEERIHTEYLGWKISGAIDLQEVYDDGIVISDYKVTSAWAVMNEKSDWHYQLNLYGWLVERVKKQKVKALQIVAIIRDWSRRDAATRDGYPKAPVTVIDIPLWSYADRDIYVANRLTLHNDAFFAMHTGQGMPLCSAEEMWEKPTMYAVMKEGGKRAKSVHTNKAEAEVAMPSTGYFIEVRDGDRTRCSGFCQVSAHCDQYQQYLSTKEQP